MIRSRRVSVATAVLLGGLPFAVAAGLLGGIVTLNGMLARGSGLNALPLWTLCGTLITGAMAFNLWMSFESLGGNRREPFKE